MNFKQLKLQGENYSLSTPHMQTLPGQTGRSGHLFEMVWICAGREKTWTRKAAGRFVRGEKMQTVTELAYTQRERKLKELATDPDLANT